MLTTVLTPIFRKVLATGLTALLAFTASWGLLDPATALTLASDPEVQLILGAVAAGVTLAIDAALKWLKARLASKA